MNLYLPSSIPVTPESVLRESQTFSSMETAATEWRTRRLTRLPTNGAGVAKTPTTSDPLACLTSTELPLGSVLGGMGCEDPGDRDTQSLSSLSPEASGGHLIGV